MTGFRRQELLFGVWGFYTVFIACWHSNADAWYWCSEMCHCTWCVIIRPVHWWCQSVHCTDNVSQCSALMMSSQCTALMMSSQCTALIMSSRCTALIMSSQCTALMMSVSALHWWCQSVHCTDNVSQCTALMMSSQCTALIMSSRCTALVHYTDNNVQWVHCSDNVSQCSALIMSSRCTAVIMSVSPLCW